VGGCVRFFSVCLCLCVYEFVFVMCVCVRAYVCVYVCVLVYFTCNRDCKCIYTQLLPVSRTHTIYAVGQRYGMSTTRMKSMHVCTNGLLCAICMYACTCIHMYTTQKTMYVFMHLYMCKCVNNMCAPFLFLILMRFNAC